MASNNIQVPILPVPPVQYDQNWANQVVRILNFYFTALQNPGPMRGTTITLTDLPTSSAGLASGSLWNDSGTVKIV
jgi:hypothetical protein